MSDNLFPTETVTTTSDSTDETVSKVTFGSSWQFDFEKGEFVTTATGKVAETQDTAAWIEWCMKALATERYRYLIYSRNHGQEFDDLIRKHLNRAGNESEIKRMVTEALMVDPRTAKVDNFTFSWDGNTCYFTCQITNVRDEVATVSNEVVIG
jgi:hypothetical protein